MMMGKLATAIALAIAATVSSAAASAGTANGASTADRDDVPAAIVTKIKATLHERFPEVPVDQVHRSFLPGLYEVVTASDIIYADETGSRLLVGHVIDSKSKEDLTAARWNDLNAIDFASLPLESAIKTVKGDGSRKLAVFTDPLCPFCQQLEQQMQTVTNVTIYSFLYPLENLHPGATAKAGRIWCARDPTAAWSAWMLQHVEPPAATCESSPVPALQALGQKLHVGATPTMFVVNGHRASGAVGPEKLEQLLGPTG
jgi:thiol:disulfide interchange protein DsbC